MSTPASSADRTGKDAVGVSCTTSSAESLDHYSIAPCSAGTATEAWYITGQNISSSVDYRYDGLDHDESPPPKGTGYSWLSTIASWLHGKLKSIYSCLSRHIQL